MRAPISSPEFVFKVPNDGIVAELQTPASPVVPGAILTAFRILLNPRQDLLDLCVNAGILPVRAALSPTDDPLQGDSARSVEVGDGERSPAIAETGVCSRGLRAHHIIRHWV